MSITHQLPQPPARKKTDAKIQVNPPAECYQHTKYCSEAWPIMETFPMNWQWPYTCKLNDVSRKKQVSN